VETGPTSVHPSAAALASTPVVYSVAAAGGLHIRQRYRSAPRSSQARAAAAQKGGGPFLPNRKRGGVQINSRRRMKSGSNEARYQAHHRRRGRLCIAANYSCLRRFRVRVGHSAMSPHVGFAPESGRAADIPGWLVRATSGLMQCSKPMLFDDLVGADKQCWRDD
jgi:hypothetical protein